MVLVESRKTNIFMKLLPRVAMVCLFISMTVSFYIPSPLTSSGILKLKLFDFVSLFGWIYSFICFIKKKIALPSLLKREALIWIMLLFVYVVAFVFRQAMHYDHLSSLTAVYAFFLPLWVLIAIVLGLIDLQYAPYEACLFTFLCFFIVWCSIIITDDVRKTLIDYMFLSTIVVAFMPFNFYLLGARGTSKFLSIMRALSIFCIVSSLVWPIIAGNRTVAAIVALEFIMLIIFFRGNSPSYRRDVFISAVLTAMVLIFFYASNVYEVRITMARFLLVLPNYRADSIDISSLKLEAEIEDLAKAALINTESSDFGRMEILQRGIVEIAKEPVLGTGRLSQRYNFVGAVFKQTYHNFIIDYLVAFGAIGALLWLGAFLLPIIPALFWCKKEIKKRFPRLIIFLLPISGVFALSLMQTILLATETNAIVWVLICFMLIKIDAIPSSNELHSVKVGVSE